MTDTASRIIRVSDIEWTAMPGMPLLKAKPLWADTDTKRRAQLARFEPGATLPMHRHVGDELLIVIEGSIGDEHGTTTAGNVGFRPNGCIHSVSSKNGATVLGIVAGGIEPATAIAGAPPSQNFNLAEIAWAEAIPGVRQKAIWHDKETKRRAALVRFEPGAKLPRHKHVGDELIFVIEGSVSDESGEVVAGNANYRPNGCTHTVTSKNGATVFALVTGGVEMIKECAPDLSFPRSAQALGRAGAKRRVERNQGDARGARVQRLREESRINELRNSPPMLRTRAKPIPSS
jgi:anti-sigma factor ChrR (cupin superfamily)